RDSYLLSIGGGATSDFSGYVAATLVRGISWGVVPTTILGLVDASVGGKVAVNTSAGKNLIGAFHAPRDIFVYSKVLETLPLAEVHSGYGEVIKYALLNDEIYNLLLSCNEVSEVFKMCMDHKIDIVEKDFNEANIRKTLNLGHTLGHAIEKQYGFAHGISVVMGMILIHHTYELNDVNQKIGKLLQKLNMSFILDDIKKVVPSNIWKYVLKDKKTSKCLTTIDIILIENGQPVIKTESLDKLKEKLNNDRNIK
ncbi:MAG: 3-dehydroquinate synthase, partial [Thermoproteota archaeon]